VHIRSAVEDQSGDAWIVPAERVGAGSPPDATECTESQRARRIDWLTQHGGVRVGSFWVRVEIVNDTNSTLTIDSLQIASIKRLPALEGRSVVTCSPGGGDIGQQYVSLDLEARPPTFRFYDATYRETRSFRFAPERNRPVVMYIVPGVGTALRSTRPQRVQWTASLRYTVDGKSHSASIDDRGRPYDVTAPVAK